MKDYREMSDEELGELTDDELRDLGVPKFTQLPGGTWIQNWCSEEDEEEFFRRNGNCFGFTSPQSRGRPVEPPPHREDPNQKA
jgi:hypothetical protein